MAKREVLRIDIAGQIPDLPLLPAMVRAHAIVSAITNVGLTARALPHIPTPPGRSRSFKTAMLLPEAGVRRIPPRWALNNLISLFSLVLLVGCCQFFRGADDVASFTISPLNMSIQPGNTQNFSALGTFGLGDTKDITSLVKWASSNPARVTIDSAGLATAIAYGTVTISGTYECYTTETSLSVVNQAAAIGSIAFNHKLRRSREISHSICRDSNLLG